MGDRVWSVWGVDGGRGGKEWERCFLFLLRWENILRGAFDECICGYLIAADNMGHRMTYICSRDIITRTDNHCERKVGLQIIRPQVWQ
jgi:hypothetical protein